MKVSNLLNQPAIKILIHLQTKGQSRHNELEKIIRSRGTLATNLNDLINEGLVTRKVIPTKPIQSNYSLTERGHNISKTLIELLKLIEP
jgi:DNA-binding HxlR family transcriptional regulator